MRHAHAGRKLDRTSAERKQLFRNLMVSLIAHERIKTTEAKAKEIQPLVEQLIRLCSEDTPHNRRVATSRLANSAAVQKLFVQIGPRFADRTGGYTRIYKLGTRLGDAASMVLIEFLPE
jgi:large subunit ribosomal protein L17